MGGLKAIINDCLTGLNGVTVDPARLLLFVGGLGFIAFSGYHVWRNHIFDPIGYGTGLGGLIAGGGAGIKIKETTEPKAD